jgi:hypothetical protein
MSIYAELSTARRQARRWRTVAIVLFIGGTVQWLAHLATI